MTRKLLIVGTLIDPLDPILRHSYPIEATLMVVNQLDGRLVTVACKSNFKSKLPTRHRFPNDRSTRYCTRPVTCLLDGREGSWTISL